MMNRELPEVSGQNKYDIHQTTEAITTSSSTTDEMHLADQLIELCMRAQSPSNKFSPLFLPRAARHVTPLSWASGRVLEPPSETTLGCV